jgi:hypothetical protein
VIRALDLVSKLARAQVRVELVEVRAKLSLLSARRSVTFSKLRRAKLVAVTDRLQRHAQNVVVMVEFEKANAYRYEFLRV